MYIYHVTSLNNLHSILTNKFVYKSSEVLKTNFERHFGSSGKLTKDIYADPLKYLEYDGVYLRINNLLSSENYVIYFKKKIVNFIDFHYNSEENSGFAISEFYGKNTNNFTTSDTEKLFQTNFSNYIYGELVMHENIPEKFFDFIKINDKVFHDVQKALMYIETIRKINSNFFKS